jgi:hypothetical protein
LIKNQLNKKGFVKKKGRVEKTTLPFLRLADNFFDAVSAKNDENQVDQNIKQEMF